MWLLFLLKSYFMIKSQILVQGFTDQQTFRNFEPDQRYRTRTEKIKLTGRQVLGAPWIPVSVIAAGQMMIIISFKITSGSMTPSKNLTFSCQIHMNIRIAQVIALKKKNIMANIKKWAKYSIAAHWQCYPLWWSKLYAKLSFFPSITSLINSKCLMVL